MANNIPTTTEISLDDADLEFDLQDEDFIGDNNVSNGNIEPTAQTPSTETSQTALNDPELQLRKKAIHIRGVDEMSSEDLTLYGKCYIPNLPFRIEWVDDSSCMF